HGTEGAGVARPAGVDDFRRTRRVAPVSAHHRRRLAAHLTDLAHRLLAATGWVDDAQLDLRRGPADCRGDDLVVIADERARAHTRLGARIPRDHRAAEHLADLADELGRDRRAAE